MEKTTAKILNEAAEVLSSAIERKMTIEDACTLLDKKSDFMTGILQKIQTAYKEGVIKEKKRDELIELYTKYTKVMFNKNSKSKKTQKVSTPKKEIKNTLKNNVDSTNSRERVENYVAGLSAAKKQIGEILLTGASPEQTILAVARAKRMSSSDKGIPAIKAYVTMVSNGMKAAMSEDYEIPVRHRLTKGSSPKGKSSKSKESKEEEFEEKNFLPNLTKKEQEELEYDAQSDDNYEERSSSQIIRGNKTFVDSKGMTLSKITSYKYKIFIKGERPLEGEFTREEMDKVYRLYSTMDGAGLTLRAVSREFTELSFRDFKRILRAFNITKSSVAVAPHIMEEYSEDELVAIIRKNKEDNILKKLEGDRNKAYEKRFFEIKREMLEFQSGAGKIEEIIESYFSKNKIKLPETTPITQKASKGAFGDESTKPLICIFGDIHFGKKFDRTIFGRGYNKEIAHERMMEIASKTIEESKKMKTKEIVMVSLGDLIECAMEDGMHPGHSMEMDLFQEEQITYAIDSIEKMLKEILANTDCNITFCSIHGNHDRIGVKRDDDKSRTAGKIISLMIKKITSKEKRLEIVIPENNLLKIKKGKICILAQHGDSGLNKRKPSELINLYGEGSSCYHLILKGHWHSLKADEGTNYLAITAPSVASADKYIMEELGHNNLPGFILGSEPNCYGFDYKKITLY